MQLVQQMYKNIIPIYEISEKFKIGYSQHIYKKYIVASTISKDKKLNKKYPHIM